MMSLEEFRGYVDNYQKFDTFTSQLYEMGMLSDDCALNDVYSWTADLICREFGADYGWFLNWFWGKQLHIVDRTSDSAHNNVDIEIDGVEEMYEFLKESPTAKEECWL